MKTKMESINWFQTTYQVQQKHRHSIVSWPSVSMKFFKHHSEVLSQVGADRTILVNLSKDVFERRTSTGSGLFSFLDSGFAQILGQLVSIIVKTLRNTNLGASRCFKMKKTSLPVDMRRSKTPLLIISSRLSTTTETSTKTGKTTILRVHQAFLYISLPSLHD